MRLETGIEGVRGDLAVSTRTSAASAWLGAVGPAEASKSQNDIHRYLERSIAATTRAVAIAFLLGAIAALWLLHRANYDEAHRHLGDMSLLLEEQTSRALQAIDNVLQDAVEDTIQGLRGDDPAAAAIWHQWLQRRGANFPQASKRLNPDAPMFIGIVAAGVDVQYFQALYERLYLRGNSAVTLLRRDATVLATYPDDLVPFTKALAWNEVLGASEESTPRSATGPSGERVSWRARALPDFPILVVVSKDTRAILQSWWQQAAWVGAGALMASLLAIAFGMLLSRQVGRARVTQRGLNDAERRWQFARRHAQAMRAAAGQADPPNCRSARATCERRGRLVAAHDRQFASCGA